MKLRALGVFAMVSLVVCVLDQGSKVWARTLPVGVPQPVIGGFMDWELAYNDGAAFSLLSGKTGGRLLLSVVAVLAFAAIGAAAAGTPPERRLRRIAYGLVAGGALGNLIDRVREGAVTDFVRWHLHGHRWPVFNLADAALVAGIVLLITEAISTHRRTPQRTVPA